MCQYCNGGCVDERMSLNMTGLCFNSIQLLLCYQSRSITGYVPCDFAFVLSKKKKLVQILDSDYHLLPRAGCPRLEKCIIEVVYDEINMIIMQW